MYFYIMFLGKFMYVHIYFFTFVHVEIKQERI